MANSTSRLALPLPVGTDPPSELRTAIGALSTAMDPSVLYYSGTLANRGTVVSSPLAGYLYYATDKGILYEYNGSAWGTVMIAGAWTEVSFSSNWTAGTYTPSSRLEGDLVRLKGVIINSTGSNQSSQVIGNIASSSMYPSTQVALTGSTPNVSTIPIPVAVTIASNGAITAWGTVYNGQGVSLDGLTYSLS